jgi:KaiC/GvpD/RAD55 family RecA-like ATPase
MNDLHIPIFGKTQRELEGGMMAEVPRSPIQLPPSCSHPLDCTLARRCVGTPICGQHELEQINQVVDASVDLDRHPDTFVRWPFADLDTLTGPMAPGDVWFVGARSGGGKTTFVTSSILRWLADGKRLYVLPLETRPKSFRTYLACLEAGVHPGDALSGSLRSTPEGQAQREKVRAALTRQTQRPLIEQLKVSPAEAISVETLEAAFAEAAEFEADVVLIDHIDHVQTDERGGDLYKQSVGVNKKVLKLAQEYDRLVVATTQLNLQVSLGDALARYQPPREQDVYLGNFKRTVATGMIGLFRPIRKPRIGEDMADYIEMMKKARKGVIPPAEALEPGMMGAVAMKLRNYGMRENERTYLGVEHGRVHDLSDRDRYVTHP